MRTDVVIVGAGQAGLAMSRCLTDRSIDHIVLERADVADSWRNQRWDSLRLLTPNWLTRLPGYRYTGDDPHGYMSARDVAEYLSRYQREIDAPVVRGAEVSALHPTADGFTVTAAGQRWPCRAVVVATGAAQRPHVPRISLELPRHLTQITSANYRNPSQLPPGDILIVGASASGVQLADELNESGRQVTLAIGNHIRLPRNYRGKDIYSWLDAIGHLDQPIERRDDPSGARRPRSVQLVGSSEGRAVDLNALAHRGVRLAGRLVGIDRATASFSDGLHAVCAAADQRMQHLLDRIDAVTDRRDHLPDRPAPTKIPDVMASLDLNRVETVIWATGFTPQHHWLDPRFLDRQGAIIHDRGVIGPGIYALGLPQMRRRNSTFIDGVGADARELAAIIHDQLRTRPPLGAVRRVGVRPHTLVLDTTPHGVENTDPEPATSTATQTLTKPRPNLLSRASADTDPERSPGRARERRRHDTR